MVASAITGAAVMSGLAGLALARRDGESWHRVLSQLGAGRRTRARISAVQAAITLGVGTVTGAALGLAGGALFALLFGDGAIHHVPWILPVIPAFVPPIIVGLLARISPNP